MSMKGEGWDITKCLNFIIANHDKEFSESDVELAEVVLCAFKGRPTLQDRFFRIH